MNIRLLQSNDAEIYWQIRLEALQKNPEAFATSYEEAKNRKNPIGRVASNLIDTYNFTFGALIDGELIGVITLIQESALKLRHRASIFAMYVTPKMRGAGVGQALLSEAIKKAQSIETIEKINLSVVTTNKEAKELYIKCGFQTFGVEEKALVYQDNYYNEEHMALFLK
ncbi:GNAT family N-acetyltransferase [Oceanobacillus halophilus]|uniref:GNAT family N-acetyltransferase n=1 Tax=Oceanobacillus halophilus TaxID=930130 RepID=A0A494ZW56_9BACI|nr:GNAT family N-acetyltransferase [Oceanobacillus halophilus]RKQ30805.1 GNAT family N-acetyltransferase [Oceanobacillus halophilus]